MSVWTLSGGVGCCSDVGGHAEEVAVVAQGSCTWGSAVEGDGEGSGEDRDCCKCSGLKRFLNFLGVLFARSCALFRSDIAQIFAGWRVIAVGSELAKT